MKKIGYFMGAALLTLGSCTNEINEEGFVDKAKTISFNAYPNKTRAVEGDVTSDNMKNDHFGVVGYKSDNSIYLYKGTNSAVEQEWQTTGASGASGTWEYSDMGDLKFCEVVLWISMPTSPTLIMPLLQKATLLLTL